MKRLFSVLLLAAILMPAYAGATPEERATRDYSTWLPSAGDWQFAVSLDPVASFIGNMFNGNVKNALTDMAGEPLLGDVIKDKTSLGRSMVSIQGGYMLSNSWMFRANVGLGFSVKSNNAYVIDEAALLLDPLSSAKVIDANKFNKLYGSVALGAEYRAGKTRPVQGVFGFGAVYSWGRTGNSYQYGNAITEYNTRPAVSGSMPSYTFVAGYMPNARLLNTVDSKLIHMFGVYGSAGVEWFVAPRIALGANVNVAMLYEVNPARANLYEGFNIMTGKVEKYTELVTPASHGFHFGVDNLGANLYMAFYFGK